MNILSSVIGSLGGNIVESIGTIIDKLHTSDDEKSKSLIALTELELLKSKISNEINLAQIQVNLQDAKGNWFQSSWRPLFGYLGVFVLAYQYVFYNLLQWYFSLYHPNVIVPVLNSQEYIMELIFGIIGLGGLRTYEKSKNCFINSKVN